MFDFEKKILKFFEKHYKSIFIIFITIVALLIRLKMYKFESGDYVVFLSKWFDYFKENGGLKALSNYPGNYAPPYMTIIALLSYLPFNSLFLIKSVSVLFDFLLAISCGLLTKEMTNNKTIPIIIYSVVLYIPSVILNGALWGQCDSIYTTFVILSLLFMFKNKNILSFLFLGLAFCFKLQFIFILPLYIVLYVVNKKFSIINFLLIPATYIFLCIPSIIMGKKLMSCIKVYFNQALDKKNELTLNFPNIYNIFHIDARIFYVVGTLFVIFLCALTLFIIIYKKVKFNKEKILLLGTWFIVLVTFFLPGMHDRYLYMSEVLSVVYFIIYKKNGILALFINMCALITYSNFLSPIRFEYMNILSIAYLIIIYYYTKTVYYVITDRKENNYE